MQYTKISFSHKIDIQIIIGFVICPIKNGIDENKEKTIINCKAEEAKAWAVMARVPGEGLEWLADFRAKEDAEHFLTLMQSVYMCGVHHEATKTSQRHDEFIHPEIESFLSHLNNQQPYNYSIKKEATGPDHWELYITEADTDETFLYVSKEDAENDIRMAVKHYNLELINISDI